MFVLCAYQCYQKQRHAALHTPTDKLASMARKQHRSTETLLNEARNRMGQQFEERLNKLATSTQAKFEFTQQYGQLDTVAGKRVVDVDDREGVQDELERLLVESDTQHRALLDELTDAMKSKQQLLNALESLTAGAAAAHLALEKPI